MTFELLMKTGLEVVVPLESGKAMALVGKDTIRKVVAGLPEEKKARLASGAEVIELVEPREKINTSAATYHMWLNHPRKQLVSAQGLRHAIAVQIQRFEPLLEYFTPMDGVRSPRLFVHATPKMGEIIPEALLEMDNVFWQPNRDLNAIMEKRRHAFAETKKVLG